MSLILQALRKSEAQRQLGRAPSLLSPMPGIPAKRGSGWRRAGYLVLVLLVAMAAWWLGQRGANNGPDVAADATAPADANRRAQRPSPSLLPVAPALVESGSIDVPAAPLRPAPRAAQAKPVTPVVPVVPPATSAASAPTTTPSRPHAPAADEPPAHAAVPAAIATPPALPTLAELPASERQSLPPLRITMHVFAEHTAQRFAIIDGHRVAEGALLGDGIVLAEITRAGVILELRGQRVLVARP